MRASGLTEVIPFIHVSAIWGQHPAAWFFFQTEADSFWVEGTPFWTPFGLRDSHLGGLKS